MMSPEQIIDILPYAEPFLFVGELSNISENGITGTYRFDKNSSFYRGHFKDHPVTPGVILTETMAQIGLVCLGIYLMRNEPGQSLPQIALSSNQVDFYLPVFPGEKVRVVSEKVYFRFNKLKCNVKMFNEKDALVCKGTIAGMIKS
jgi:3-hydroxyacyl-[acyl-carrier-protein] dehydratase